MRYGKRIPTSEADLEAYIKKGLRVRDSWKPRVPVPTVHKKSESKRYGSGFRADLGIYVRSTWEANVGRILNWQLAHKEIVKWRYESQEFEFPVKRGSRFYKTDFEIWRTEDSFFFWEVKGWLRDADRTKLKRMQKYYPQHEVVLIQERQYRELERTYAKLIPTWEYHADGKRI